MRDTDGEFIGAVIKLVLAIILLVIIEIFSSNSDKADYNNGTCSYCGGHWVYETAVGHKSSTGYIYICDKCGRSIEIGQKLDADY